MCMSSVGSETPRNIEMAQNRGETQNRIEMRPEPLASGGRKASNSIEITQEPTEQVLSHA